MPSNSSKFRVAMLGAGGITVPHLLALQSVAGAEVIAICDLEENRARALQERFGIPEWFADFETMLAQTSPDVVHVLLPASLHAAAAEKCLAAGSHVLVEKPFCVSVEKCRMVALAGERAGRQIGVNHNLTFMPRVMQLVDAIRACRLGAVQHVRVMYSLPMPGLAAGPHGHWMFGDTGNVILELGPHPLSIICRLLGRVTAASATVSGEMRLSNGVQFFRNWQSSLVCERGDAQCVLATGTGLYSASVHVLGEDGEAFVDLRRNTLRISEKTRYIRIADLADGWSGARGLMRQSLGNFVSYGLGSLGLRPPYLLQNISVRNSVGNFYEALRSGGAPAVGAAQGTAVVEACEMVIEGGRGFAERKSEAGRRKSEVGSQ